MSDTKTPFTESYESIKFEFDEDYASWGKDDQVFDLSVRDGSGNAYVGLTVEQTEALRDLINAEIDKYFAWREAQAQKNASTTEQENQ